jgi:hypothetical protein
MNEVMNDIADKFMEAVELDLQRTNREIVHLKQSFTAQHRHLDDLTPGHGRHGAQPFHSTPNVMDTRLVLEMTEMKAEIEELRRTMRERGEPQRTEQYETGASHITSQPQLAQGDASICQLAELLSKRENDLPRMEPRTSSAEIC